jgi:nucleotide sugar dehydrogenase
MIDYHRRSNSLEIKYSESRPKVVIVGLGYVGLNLASNLAINGICVQGLDVSQEVVDRVNAGRIAEDIVDAELLKGALRNGIVSTTDESIIREARTIVICVPTPLNESGLPEVKYILEAAGAISRNMVTGQLVILESTSFPGTTREILSPVLENSGLIENEDFFVAFSSERVNPGSRHFNIKNTPKIVACESDKGLNLAQAF